MAQKVRTRFAPSPTGRVHIGSVQKIAYSYACAKHFGGEYILRIEDTDQKRKVDGAEEEIYRLHEILGMVPDESPINPGAVGPYRQSERLNLYKEYAEELIEKGYAYYAFETTEELAAMRASQQANKERPRYQGIYRDMPLAESKALAASGKPYVIRIKVPANEEVIVDDLIMGKIKFATNELDDYILLKSDGYPTYHLAMVVDDHLMGITHVFRGVEWIPTAPIHFLLFKYLGWDVPVIAHIPNILDPNGGKLSKRSGSVAALDFFAEGYLPAAVANFIILLAWSPKTDQEIISMEEFINLFDLAKFNKSNPVFNRDKLKWFNEQYIRKLTPEELTDAVKSWANTYHNNSEIAETISSFSDEKLTAVLTLEQERITVLMDLADKLKSFVEFPQKVDFDHKFLKNLPPEKLVSILAQYSQLLDDQGGNWDHDKWELGVRNIGEALGLKPREVFMTLRLAVTGTPASPPLFEYGEIIGLSEHKRRIEQAINQLK